MSTGICQNPSRKGNIWPEKYLPVRNCSLGDFAPGLQVFGVIKDGTILSKEGTWMTEKAKGKEQ